MIDVGRKLDTLEFAVGELREHSNRLTDDQKERLSRSTEQLSDLADEIAD